MNGNLSNRMSSSRSGVSPFKPEARCWLPVSDKPTARRRVAAAGLKRTRALGTRLVRDVVCSSAYTRVYI